MFLRKLGVISRRWLSDEVAKGEKRLADLLKKHFPKADEVSVEDTSGQFASLRLFFRRKIISTIVLQAVAVRFIEFVSFRRNSKANRY